MNIRHDIEGKFQRIQCGDDKFKLVEDRFVYHSEKKNWGLRWKCKEYRRHQCPKYFMTDLECTYMIDNKSVHTCTSKKHKSKTAKAKSSIFNTADVQVVRVEEVKQQLTENQESIISSSQPLNFTDTQFQVSCQAKQVRFEEESSANAVQTLVEKSIAYINHLSLEMKVDAGPITRLLQDWLVSNNCDQVIGDFSSPFDLKHSSDTGFRNTMCTNQTHVETLTENSFDACDNADNTQIQPFVDEIMIDESKVQMIENQTQTNLNEEDETITVQRQVLPDEVFQDFIEKKVTKSFLEQMIVAYGHPAFPVNIIFYKLKIQQSESNTQLIINHIKTIPLARIGHVCDRWGRNAFVFFQESIDFVENNQLDAQYYYM